MRTTAVQERPKSPVFRRRRNDEVGPEKTYARKEGEAPVLHKAAADRALKRLAPPATTPWMRRLVRDCLKVSASPAPPRQTAEGAEQHLRTTASARACSSGTGVCRRAADL